MRRDAYLEECAGILVEVGLEIVVDQKIRKFVKMASGGQAYC